MSTTTQLPCSVPNIAKNVSASNTDITEAEAIARLEAIAKPGTSVSIMRRYVKFWGVIEICYEASADLISNDDCFVVSPPLPTMLEAVRELERMARTMGRCDNPACDGDWVHITSGNGVEADRNRIVP